MQVSEARFCNCDIHIDKGGRKRLLSKNEAVSKLEKLELIGRYKEIDNR